MRSLWLVALIVSLLASGSLIVRADDFEDAISRELSVHNSIGTNEFGDAVSRELSVYNSGATDMWSDAISREMSIYNGVGGNEFADAISRELSVKNSPPADFALDAISREFTVLNEFLGGTKLRSDGSSVKLLGTRGVAVTAVFGDCIYVASVTRVSGIRVTGVTASVGDRVNLTGTMATDTSNDERYLAADSIIKIGMADIAPVAVTCRSIYCGDLRYDSLTGAGQRGMNGGLGQNIVGVLVCLVGTVTDSWDRGFLLSDGYTEPVRIWVVPGTTPPSRGDIVRVSGVLVPEKVDGQLYPAIRMRLIDQITVIE